MTKPLSEAVARMLDQGIAQAPFGRRLGMRLERCAEDEVVLRMPFDPSLTTMGDTVHGGAIASLADAAATAAAWAKDGLPAGARGTTVSLSVHYLAGARGCDLEAHARVRRRGRSISTCEVSVRDAGGQEVAFALATYKLSAS